MSGGRVVFVGGGPGAPDLLTLRAARALADADIVIWGRSLLAEDAVREHMRAGGELIAWPPCTLPDVLRAYDRARDEELTVVRLKSGDPTLFGEMEPELTAVRDRGLAFEIVPGVSSVATAAAVLHAELAGADEPLLLSAARGQLDSRALAEVARAGGTVALLARGSRAQELEDALLTSGFASETPCAVAHRVSWPGELVLRCPLSELAERIRDLGLDELTVVLVGGAIGRATGPG